METQIFVKATKMTSKTDTHTNILLLHKLKNKKFFKLSILLKQLTFFKATTLLFKEKFNFTNYEKCIQNLELCNLLKQYHMKLINKQRNIQKSHFI